jgi:hypothetical protein
MATISWEGLIHSFYALIGSEEENKRKLWEYASIVKDEYGARGLREFSDEIKDTFGQTRSYNTLRKYANLHKISKKYNLPNDFPDSVIRAFCEYEDKDRLIKRIREEGLSAPEVYKIIKESQPKKVWRCPKCKGRCKLELCEKE